ncbi:MAG TPA: efflux RND transporter periplasmic adaptor subunit [Methylocystis sp.]|nr:efflux RND transporter periplasmic adaptor subunit [Methylocystis sp.]
MKRTNVLVLLLATTPLSLSTAACDRQSKGAEDHTQTRPVLVAVAHYAAAMQRREFAAVIRPRIESDLGFRVPGKVLKRLVEVGQVVKAGDVLATLDDTDLKLQKEQADAELAAANAAVLQSSADETRAAALRRGGWTAQAALDRARAAAQEARGRKERGARSVDLARNNLDYATLRADASGVVTATMIEAGQVVAGGAPAVRLARSDELEAAVAVPEGYVSEAREGEAELYLWSRPETVHHAKLRELSPSADPATRNFAARFSILEADPHIAIGMSATLAIVNKDHAPALGVPLSAIYDDGRGSSLWRVSDDGRLELVRVAMRRFDSSMAFVSGPINEGDRIVILGVHKLDSGQRVRVMEERETMGGGAR